MTRRKCRNCPFNTLSPMILSMWANCGYKEQPKLSKIDYATSYFHEICIEYTFRSIDHRFIFNHNSMTTNPSDGSMLMIVLHLMVTKVSISVIIFVFFAQFVERISFKVPKWSPLQSNKMWCDFNILSLITFYGVFMRICRKPIFCTDNSSIIAN